VIRIHRNRFSVGKFVNPFPFNYGGKLNPVLLLAQVAPGVNPSVLALFPVYTYTFDVRANWVTRDWRILRARRTISGLYDGGV